MYSEIHDLIYHGNGGFNYNDVYQLPVHIRKLHIEMISKHIEAQNKKIEAQNSKGSAPPSAPVYQPPKVNPTYTSKKKSK